MALEKQTDYGKITISDKVFEELISNFCQLPELYDRIWLASKPNIKSRYNDSGRIEINLSVYVKFGQSIKGVSKELADKIDDSICRKTGTNPSLINVNVSGVKSGTLVRRNIDIPVEYD